MCSVAITVAVELWDHGDPLDSARNDALAELAIRMGVDLIATNNVHYATARPPAVGLGVGGRASPPFARRARWMVARFVGRPSAIRR